MLHWNDWLGNWRTLLWTGKLNDVIFDQKTKWHYIALENQMVSHWSSKLNGVTLVWKNQWFYIHLENQMILYWLGIWRMLLWTGKPNDVTFDKKKDITLVLKTKRRFIGLENHMMSHWTGKPNDVTLAWKASMLDWSGKLNGVTLV